MSTHTVQIMRRSGTFEFYTPAYGWLLGVLLWALVGACQASDEQASAHREDVQKLLYWQPSGTSPDSSNKALSAWQRGLFTGAPQSTPTFGLAARPVWLALVLENTQEREQQRHLLLDASWLDDVTFYLVHDGTILQRWQTGDAQPFGDRSPSLTGFDWSFALPPGQSQILIRVATPDPMVLPVHILDKEQREKLVITRLLSYGAGYGFLLALMLYNAMLYCGLRDRRHLLYSLYLGSFILANISYTGHGFAWLWPQAVEWQRWGQPLLMGLFGTMALVFSVEYLDIRRHWRAGLKLCLWACSIFWASQIVFIGWGLQGAALISAFSFMVVYTLLMLWLGIDQWRGDNPNAPYFLIAIAAGTLGALITTLSTWGWLPTNEFTFRAAELGMVIEATLLALALAARFRHTQREGIRARLDANTDSLTGLCNRRALQTQLERLWSESERHGNPFSIVIMDVDHFKKLNDTYGHAGGDEVLMHIGQVIRATIRQEDIAARWGGEEFLIAMPHADAIGAMEFAERLRRAIGDSRVSFADHTIRFTASFGIAQKDRRAVSTEALVILADEALYRAKILGRNRSELSDSRSAYQTH